MEAARQVHQIAVEVAGVVVPGGQAQLLAEEGELLDEGRFRLPGEEGGVHVRSGGDGLPLGGQVAKETANPGVGVLHIVDGVLAVLPDRQP